MDISTIASIGSATPYSDGAKGGNALGKQDFLNLLLMQLSQQDPLNPMDNTEFTAQLSQFSSLEELANINSTLNDVLVFQQSMQNASIANLIGKSVKADGNTAYLTNNADMYYELSDDASSVEITIYDSSGKLVRTDNLTAKNAGAQNYVWDGKDDNGNQLSEGLYTFGVDAQDASGNPVHAQTSASGTVKEVLFEKGFTFIILDSGAKINLSDIKSIG
ncbi:MAG: flagellar hook assembly protein FlgD [Nitrospirae bacterium]|nr:flagellar hook assembly protein FlgD [Nitrospirota bacterium]